MLYATCSVFRDENEAVVSDFLAGTPSARRCALNWRFGPSVEGVREPLEPIDQLLPADRRNRRHDGFFYAVLIGMIFAWMEPFAYTGAYLPLVLSFGSGRREA